jgi:hypothetical protein
MPGPLPKYTIILTQVNSGSRERISTYITKLYTPLLEGASFANPSFSVQAIQLEQQ